MDWFLITVWIVILISILAFWFCVGLVINAVI